MTGRQIGVFGLNEKTTSFQVTRRLSQSGNMERFVMVIDQKTGKFKGYAFATYTKASEARRAIRDWDNTKINGRRISVQFATSRDRR
jgi:transformer-2 protein